MPASSVERRCERVGPLVSRAYLVLAAGLCADSDDDLADCGRVSTPPEKVNASPQ
jgi:hypothetical protein